MIRVLHIISPGNGKFGGIEKYLYEQYKFFDRKQFLFDFLFCRSNTMKLIHNDEIFENSGFYELNILNQEDNKIINWIKLTKSVKGFLRKNQYDIVEVHSGSPLILAICGLALKMSKIKVKIAHSHALLSGRTGKIYEKLLLAGCRSIIRSSFNIFFACSYEAGEVFGKRLIDTNRFIKMNNAIDIEKYFFNSEKRTCMRRKYNISENTIVLGHVARLTEEKNQKFLIDVFCEFHKICENSILWIIGDGNYREELVRHIKKLDISSSVVLAGEKKEVSDFLQMMDIFLVTSLYEGLCISAIEAQAAGIPTYISSGVPKECILTECCVQLSSDSSPAKWAQFILEDWSKHDKDNSDGFKKNIRRKGYDVRQSAKKLEKLYMNLIIKLNPRENKG